MATARDINNREKMRQLVAASPDIQKPNFIRMIVYGDYGAGKTTFSTKFCQKGNFMVSAEEGAHVLSNWPDLNKRTKVIPWKGIDMFRELGTAIAEGEYPDRDTLVLDTLTAAADTNMEQILAANDFKERDSPLSPCPRDYKIQESMWRIPSLAVSKLPINLIINVHEREPAMNLDSKVDKRTDDEKKYRPDAANGVIKYFMRTVDFIVRLQKTPGGERIVTLDSNFKFVAKNRANLKSPMNEEEFIKAVWRWRNGTP